jgi:hypothetical protein
MLWRLEPNFIVRLPHWRDLFLAQSHGDGADPPVLGALLRDREAGRGEAIGAETPES